MYIVYYTILYEAWEDLQGLWKLGGTYGDFEAGTKKEKNLNNDDERLITYWVLC